ncbi:MAG: 8-oxo-dGTP diphosphatase [Elusimicrobia bacterium]|nr:8-oxo-dGTP diphosphatase [Elusimicrobiota bacterium]
METDLMEPAKPGFSELAVLCFLIKDGRILLIRKKQGLGTGKITAPGGRIEPGESALDAACRETTEEVGLTPSGLAQAGELHFQFADGYKLHCTVFTAREAEGALIETDEAAPIWTDICAIPYKDMWADDELWMPWMLAGKPFQGHFRFDGDRMLSASVEPSPRA